MQNANHSDNTPENQPEQLDANGWPIDFFEKTAGSLPDFPEREPQGNHEQRLELEMDPDQEQ